ncbi:MAG TPA: helix-turn-helix domain-containing protein, partial [Solirubrobacteraceae bacterium]
ARLARSIGLGALDGPVDDLPVLFVPDPAAPGRRRVIESALAGAPAVLGPVVGWPESGVSFARATAAARLGRAGLIDWTGLVLADDHLTLLALHADPSLAAALAARGLAPLRAVEPAAARERLTETLRAWLDRPGQVQAVAAVLDVHPQTVRYRLRQLRELYGAALEDPEQRLALSLAVRAAAAHPLSV